MAKLYLLFSLFLLANARFGLGPCRNIELQENFDINKYLGTWYEQARAKSIPFQTGDCDTQELSLPQGSEYVKVRNSERRDDKISDIEGVAYCDDGTAQCHVKLGGPVFGDYRVVSTDYTGYTLVYSCTNFYLFHLDYVWFMTRERSKTVADYDLDDYLDLVHFNEGQVQTTNQLNCLSEF